MPISVTAGLGVVQMVPRLWEYQVEFPARTVAHFMLGFTIGVILLLKVSILRWFRHFEEWMPVLGVGLLTCTVLLSALSLPFVFRELSKLVVVSSVRKQHRYEGMSLDAIRRSRKSQFTFDGVTPGFALWPRTGACAFSP